MHKQNTTSQETPSQEYYVGFIPNRHGTWVIEIDEPITNVRQVSGAIQCLNNATENDNIEIHLQCAGGSVSAGDALIHAMRKCEAPIHIVATGLVASMATFILLEADSFELSEGFHALLHCGSLWDGGTTAEFEKSSEFSIKHMHRLMDRYEYFVSAEQIKDLKKGVDIWMDAQQWIDATTARSEMFKLENEAVDIPEELLEKLTNPLPELTFTGIEGAFDSFGEEKHKRKVKEVAKPPSSLSREDTKKAVLEVIGK